MSRRPTFWIPFAALLVVVVVAGTRRGGERGRPPTPAARRAAAVPSPASAIVPLPKAPALPEPRVPGPIDVRVAAIAATLSLIDRQRDEIRRLVEAYAGRFDHLLRSTDWTNGDARERFGFAHRRLQLEYDQQVVALLTPAQADVYGRMAESDRSADLDGNR